MFTAPQITWHGAGRPALGYDVTTHHGHCATCGAAIDGVAVHIKEIECPTLTQHADFMAHGQHVCPACAWLYGAGKGKPGNFIATPDKYEQAVIGRRRQASVADHHPGSRKTAIRYACLRGTDDRRQTALVATDAGGDGWRIRVVCLFAR